MADEAPVKISLLAALGAAPALDDIIPLVDTSTGATKTVTVEYLLSELLNILKFAETVNAIGTVNAGNSPVSIDMSLGGVHTLTIAGDVTIQFDNWPHATKACKAEVVMTDGDAHTVIWPGAVNWPSGTAPDLTGRARLVFATEDNGTTIDGFQAGEGMA